MIKRYRKTLLVACIGSGVSLFYVDYLMRLIENANTILSVADYLACVSGPLISAYIYMPLLIVVYILDIQWLRTPTCITRIGRKDKCLKRELLKAMEIAGIYALEWGLLTSLFFKQKVYMWCSWKGTEFIFVLLIFWCIQTMKGFITLTIVNGISWIVGWSALYIVLPLALGFWGEYVFGEYGLYQWMSIDICGLQSVKEFVWMLVSTVSFACLYYCMMKQVVKRKCIALTRAYR